jgi:putative aldouronate transport system permease protein
VGVYVAFTDYKVRRGVFGSEFVGLKNFEFLYATGAAERATRNTITLNVMFITVGMAFALLLAWLMFEVYSSRITKFYQTMLLLPRFISWVVVSYFVFALLATDNGLINNLLEDLGREPVLWYFKPNYWPIILLLVTLWSGMGINSLFYLSGMLAIDPQLFEAARIDGANKWKQFWYISLPLLRPLIVINLLLSFAYVLSSDFGLFFQVTGNKPILYPRTDVLDTYIYRSLTVTKSLSMAAAAQFYQSLVGFVLVICANWLVRRFQNKDESLSLF